MKSVTRIFAIMRKEFLQLSRDRLTFGMIIGIPLIQLLMFGYAINTDVRHLSAAYVDEADTHLSRQFVADIGASQVLIFKQRVASVQELEQLLDAGSISIGMALPDDFDRTDVIFAGCVIPGFVLDDPVECEHERCTWSGGTLDGQRVGSSNLGLADFVYTQELDNHYSNLPEGEHMIPVEDLERMTIEITLGWKWGDPRSRVAV